MIRKTIITNKRTHDGTAIITTHPFDCILPFLNKKTMRKILIDAYREF
jgi:hypothetical protein